MSCIAMTGTPEWSESSGTVATDRRLPHPLIWGVAALSSQALPSRLTKDSSSRCPERQRVRGSPRDLLAVIRPFLRQERQMEKHPRNRGRGRGTALWIAAALLVFAVPVLAQNAGSTIQGTVKDETGGAI